MGDRLLNLASADGDEVTYTPLVEPVLLFIVSCIVCVVVYRRFRDQIDGWLAQSKKTRQLFRVSMLILLPVGLAVCVDVADLSMVRAGKFERLDIAMLDVAVLFGPVWLLCQALEAYHSDHWDDRILALTNRAEESQELHLAAQQNRDFLVLMGRVILRIIGMKSDRVQAAVQNLRNPSDNQRITAIRRALDPSQQILRTIIAIHGFFRQRMGIENSLRVAYFVDSGNGYLNPMCSFDGTNEHAIQTPANQHRERFRLEGDIDQACLVIASAVNSQVWVIGNADEAHDDPDKPFEFFDDHQRRSIKSIVTLPLRRRDAAPPCRHVVSIDTDRIGFFESSITLQELEMLAENLAHRLLFEHDMRVLLGP